MTLRLQRIEPHKRQGSKPTWRIGEHEGDKVAPVTPVEGRDWGSEFYKLSERFGKETWKLFNFN